MPQEAIALLTATGLLVFYLLLAWFYPYAQWTRFMMGEKVPKPYVDVPFQMWRRHRRSFLSWRYIALSIGCAALTSLFAVMTEKKSLAMALVAIVFGIAPIYPVRRRVWRLWRDRSSA